MAWLPMPSVGSHIQRKSWPSLFTLYFQEERCSKQGITLVRTDNASPTVFQQRIVYCPALANRQHIVKMGVGPGSFSWRTRWSVCPPPPFHRRSAPGSYSAKAVISRLFLPDERPRSPRRGELHVTGCCPTRLADPMILAQGGSALTASK